MDDNTTSTTTSTTTLTSPWYVYIPLALSLYIITKYFLRKLRNLPPSPILDLPFIGHLYLLKKPLYRALGRISDRHGPVVLLQLGSRPVLVVSSPAAAEECLAKNDIIFANRPNLASGKHFGYNFKSIVWSSYGDHWRNLRRLSATEILSAHKLQLLHWIRVDEVRSLIRNLDRASREGSAVDMKIVFFELTMNVVMRMIAGKRYYGENVEEVEAADRFREIVKEVLRLGGASNTGDFLPVLKWLSRGGLENELRDVQRRRDEFMQELVLEGRKNLRSKGSGEGDDGGKVKSMLEMLLALQEKEPEYYTDEIIRSLMATLLVAGSDTSAGTLEWALSLLVNNPHVLKKAQMEIDNHVGQDRLIEESDIAELPYLRCILNETLRLYPAGPLLIPHESSEQCTIGGYHVPAKTMLLVNVWAIHNDPKNWEEPRKFKPERFEGLEGTRDGFKLIPFGSGRRGCPGEALAVRILGYALGSISQCFDWERVGKDLVDMTEAPGLSMPRAHALMAYCKARPIAAKVLSQI